MKIKKLSEKLITLGIIAVIVALMYIFDVRCFFKLLFKISCPGCGMTRAWLSLLKLDIATAFRYHPMFWSAPILGALYLFDGEIFKQKWLNYLITTGILGGLIACWVVRLIMGWQV